MKVATPSTVPRADSGTHITECIPNSAMLLARAGSSSTHGAVATSRNGSSTAAPLTMLSKYGEDLGASIESPVVITDSGQPSWIDCCPARRTRYALSAGPEPGSSPCSTDSSRSTVTKSASRGTEKSASSWAVRITLSVPPIQALASLSRASRSRARHLSVTSMPM